MRRGRHAGSIRPLEADALYIRKSLDTTQEKQMPEPISADLTLNLEGLMCPMPVVKISQAMKEVPVGAVVAATATDPGVMADIPAWARTSGNELIKMEREGKLVRFYVRRLK